MEIFPFYVNFELSLANAEPPLPLTTVRIHGVVAGQLGMVFHGVHIDEATNIITYLPLEQGRNYYLIKLNVFNCCRAMPQILHPPINVID